MPSSKEYLDFVLEQLSNLTDISHRAMMSEYIIYYDDKIVGGIYDDRLLLKPVNATTAPMPNAKRELPYKGAKEMLLMENMDDRAFLEKLFRKMYKELPLPKKKK